ncbi:MAG: acyltransferase family protein [Eubacteriales bacterium]|nr:acyltransferase family protein [Eubacteriales bacterium]
MEVLCEKKPEGGRDYRMDNLKCLLIFSVVLGHMLELCMGKNPGGRTLYLIIYSLHMPLFAFVTGVFARYRPERIRSHMIYPYLVFQTLYLLFANLVLEKDADVQYTTPYWLLWYLFALIVWNLVLPLVSGEEMSWKKKLFFLAASFGAGLLIGFDDKAGYYLSVSRIVEFFPYFLMGVYYRQAAGLRRRRSLSGRRAARLLALAATVFVVCLVAGYAEEIKSVWLYGSVSYEKGDYSLGIRAAGVLAALVWLGFFLLWMPGSRLPLVSRIGANTMPVYLLHGFLVKLFSKIRLFSFIENDIRAAVLLSALLVLLLSWAPLVRLLSPLFCWKGTLLRKRTNRRRAA